MEYNDIGLIVAINGLGLWLAFSQTARYLAISQLTRILSLVIIPVAAAALWRIALELQWWTVLVFIGSSLIVGTITAIAAHKIGKAAVYSMQPVFGLGGAALVAASWFLR